MLTHIPPKFWNFKPCRKCLWSSLDASEAFMCSKTWYALVNWEFCWTVFFYKKDMPLRRKNLLMLEKATFNQTWPSICSFPVRARKGFLFVLVWIKNIPRNLSFLYFASVWNQWQWNLQSLHWRWLYNHSSFPSFKDIYNFFSLVFVCKRVISFLLFEGHQVGATRPLTALLTNHSENSEKSALTKKRNPSDDKKGFKWSVNKVFAWWSCPTQIQWVGQLKN